MNSRQKEILQSQLDGEQEVLKKLQGIYKKALEDVNGHISSLMGRTDTENLQSIVYQLNYQNALKTQINGILDNLASNQYTTISDYLAKCYENGFVGTMYDLHGQGIPLVFPINQDLVVRAVQNDAPLVEAFYDYLGEDVNLLKKRVRNNISRGIAQGSSYAEIARNIERGMIGDYSKVRGGALYDAYRIARTEGHRITNAATYDAQTKAKEKGADVVKQWDSTMDRRTRKHHTELDGQLRELDEPFEVAGRKAMYPGGFGVASEDINCRCAVLQRARWALDEEELQTLKDRAAFFGLDKTEDFEDFKKKYLDASKNTIHNGDTIVSAQYPEYRRIIRAVDAVKDAENTNPNYSKLTYEYTNNCQRCVPAWELRQRGFDVIAQPCKPLGEYDALQRSPFSPWNFNAFDADVSKRVQADRVGTGKEKIIEFLKTSGNGARAEIVVTWDYNKTTGHVFAAKNIDGNILFIDPQNGKSGQFVEEYFDRVEKGETRWLRIDNLPLQERCRNEVIKNPYE